MPCLCALCICCIYQVYGELLGVLDLPVTELLAIEGCAEDLLACFDDAGGAAVAGLVDYKAAVSAGADETAAPGGSSS